MDIFVMQHKYKFIYLVVINVDVYVYKNEKGKFDQPFLSFKPKYIFMANQKFVE